ncbi:MAG: NAD(P)/FAD-dependent oxidoreductase [Burkholderiaceae bacterium]|nr:NAD(P)/FAD-dependent oxidoreductase [Burkholderiaceae bacterium]
MGTVDAVVVGAGVVGLAVARELALRGREVWVLEAEDAIGTQTSSRNSEVIHAGLYYQAGSLKGRLCVAGKALLYDYCAVRGIAHRRCGKLIVATTEAEIGQLEALIARAAAIGVTDLVRLEGTHAQALEPALSCVAAVLSPSTGIVDSHGLMSALQGDLENAGGLVALRAPLISAHLEDSAFLLQVGGADPIELRARTLINSAGLGAVALARAIAGLDAGLIPPAYLAKGNYYALAVRAPFSRLVYPVPQAAGLGVHLTLDLAGQARFGPDVEWIEEIHYRVDPARSDAFYASIRQYWPELPDNSLVPAYSGIRPKIQAPAEPARDFMIQGPAAHGTPGLVNLFGIESPGLTACLALGSHVADLIAAP